MVSTTTCGVAMSVAFLRHVYCRDSFHERMCATAVSVDMFGGSSINSEGDTASLSSEAAIIALIICVNCYVYGFKQLQLHGWLLPPLRKNWKCCDGVQCHRRSKINIRVLALRTRFWITTRIVPFPIPNGHRTTAQFPLLLLLDLGALFSLGDNCAELS